MGALSVRLPESIHENARRYAKREGVSINQLVASAVAEKLAAIGAAEFLRARAERGSRDKFLAALGRVADAPPQAGDLAVVAAG